MNPEKATAADANEPRSDAPVTQPSASETDLDGPSAWTLAGLGRGLFIATVSLAVGAAIGILLVPSNEHNDKQQKSVAPTVKQLSQEDVAFIAPIHVGSNVLTYEVAALQTQAQGIKLQLVAGNETVNLRVQRGNAQPAPATFGPYAVFYDNSGAGQRDGSNLAQALAKQLAAHANEPPPPALR